MKLLYRRCSGFFWPSLQKICYAILSCLLRILHSTGIKLVTRHFRICITRTRPILRMILVATIGIGITGVIESTDATQVDLGKTLRKVCTSPFLKMFRCSLFQDTGMTAHCTQSSQTSHMCYSQKWPLILPMTVFNPNLEGEPNRCYLTMGSNCSRHCRPLGHANRTITVLEWSSDNTST